MTSKQASRFAACWITLAMIGLAPLHADAATRFARATGLWNAAIWSATSCVAGALTASTPGAADDVTICAGFTVTLDSSRTANTIVINGSMATSTFTLTVDNNNPITLNSGGSFSGNAALNIDNTTTLLAGSATGITFGNLTLGPATLGGSRTYTLGGGSIASVTVTGDLDITTTNAAGAARSLSVVRGTVTTLAVTGRTRMLASGAGNDSTLLNTTGMTTFTSGTVVLGDAAGGTGTNTLLATTAAITLNGAAGPLFTRNANGVFTAGTSTVTMNSPNSVALTSGTFTTVTNRFNNLTVSMAGQTGTLGADIDVNSQLLVSAGTLSNNGNVVTGGTLLQVNDGATYAMTGTTAFPTFGAYTFQSGAYPSCSTVSYRQTTTPLTITNQTYGHLDLAPAGAATQRFAAGTYTINCDLVVGNATNAAIADAATNSAILDVNGGVNIKANGTLLGHQDNAISVARDWINNGTFTPGTGNAAVTFDGTIAAAIGGASATTFPALNLSKTATVTTTANTGFTVNKKLTISSSNTLADGGTTITAKGDLDNSGTHSGTGKIVLTGGSAAHALSGTGTYGNLELNDSNGATLGASPTVSGTLTFTTGNITTGSSNTLTMASTAITSGAGPSKHVVGNLVRAFSAATTFTYDIGDGTNYTKLQVTFTAGVTGNLTASVTNTDHPNTTSSASGVDSGKSVNRYWTIKSSTVTGTYAATFNYISGTPTDLDSGVTASNFGIRRGTTCTLSGASRTCAAWGGLTVSGTPTTTAATASGVTITSGDPEADFAIGEAVSSNFSREKQFIYTRELY